jgi:serine/threonine protein kinase
MQLAGLQLGSFHILQLIGSGGMGDVYLAEDPRINRRVAIKVIRIEKLFSPSPASAQEAIRLFRREAKAVAKLDHPHILALYHYDEVLMQGTRLLYIVMPLCQEGSLRTWLRKRNVNPLLMTEEVAPLLLQAADALQHAHDNHIIHLDVKPDNFLLRNQKNSTIPYLLLADFGIAAIINATTNAGMRGTPAYMAPEQWESRPVPATDQYALAVMAYRLLTGRTPFQGNEYQLRQSHLFSSPQSPSTLNPSISSDIDAIILKALEKNPEDRFPSVLIFAQAFLDATRSSESLSKVEVYTRRQKGRLRSLIKLLICCTASTGAILYLLSLSTISPAVPIIGCILTVMSCVLGLVQTAWFRQWNWFVSILVASPMAGIIYGLFGPITKSPTSRESLLVGLYKDKTNKARNYIFTAILVAFLFELVLTSYYISYAVNNAVYKATAPGKLTIYASLTRENPTQYYSLVNNIGDFKWVEKKGCTFTTEGYVVSYDSQANDNSSGFFQSNFNTCYLQKANYSDFVIQIQMKIFTGNGGGILFRDSGGDGRAFFYYLRINKDGSYELSFYVDKQSDNFYSVMSGEAPSFQTGLGQVNTIALVAKGSLLDLFINGHYINSHSDSGSEQGAIALVAQSFSIVAYDKAKVWVF